MSTVICSGYFSILTVGHIDYFREASEIGDWVICILNNDNQLLNKYGFVPVNQDQRKKVVEAIKYIDEVVIAIDQDSSIASTIDRIFPAISYTKCFFINGGDRNTSNSNLQETEICNRLGIQILYLGGLKINSSSSICQIIKDNYGKNQDYYFNG